MFGLDTALTKGLAIAAGVSALAAIALGVLLKGAYEDLGAARASLKTVVATNESNQETITELEAANAEWARRHGADLEHANQLLADAISERDQVRGVLARRQAEWEDLYGRNPDADTYRRIPVPDPVAERMRRNRRGDRDPDGDGVRAEVHGDPAGPDPADPGP